MSYYEEACLQHLDMEGEFGGCDEPRRFVKDSLYYHRYMIYTNIKKETKKAYLFQMNNVSIWVSKKLCRKLDRKYKTVYIWEGVFE